jgi:hypothetical protein
MKKKKRRTFTSSKITRNLSNSQSVEWMEIRSLNVNGVNAIERVKQFGSHDWEKALRCYYNSFLSQMKMKATTATTRTFTLDCFNDCYAVFCIFLFPG